VKNILSFLLICVLSLPSIIGLTHFILEDHIVCHDQEIHFHKAEIDCSTCDFVRVSFDYNSSQFDIKNADFLNFKELNLVPGEIYFSKYIIYFDSRGPPVDC
jgi:hypothetical protein